MKLKSLWPVRSRALFCSSDEFMGAEIDVRITSPKGLVRLRSFRSWMDASCVMGLYLNEGSTIQVSPAQSTTSETSRTAPVVPSRSQHTPQPLGELSCRLGCSALHQMHRLALSIRRKWGRSSFAHNAPSNERQSSRSELQ
jgi:hypothetical protein